jgi:hypothetical protein
MGIPQLLAGMPEYDEGGDPDLDPTYSNDESVDAAKVDQSSRNAST